MARLKGGYYTLDFTPQVIEDLGLEAETLKSIPKSTKHPFIQRLNELFIDDDLKIDKPLLIKYVNGGGNMCCNFNDSTNGLIVLGSSDVLLEISTNGDNFEITYHIA